MGMISVVDSVMGGPETLYVINRIITWRIGGKRNQPDGEKFPVGESGLQQCSGGAEEARRRRPRGRRNSIA
jgi:hypothetical protein